MKPLAILPTNRAPEFPVSGPQCETDHVMVALTFPRRDTQDLPETEAVSLSPRPAPQPANQPAPQPSGRSSVAVAAPTPSALSWWREVALVLAFYASYTMVRNFTRGDAAVAFANAERVMRLQQRLGLNVELAWQAWVLPHTWVVVAANYFYGSANFVVTVGVLIWCYRRFPADYRLVRRSLSALILVSLAAYVAFPLMPPRLLDRLGSGAAPGISSGSGFVDTMATYPTFWSFASSSVDKVTNQFAAMPSLHCAFAIWCAWALVPRCRRRATKTVAVLYPIVTAAVVVVTGNHFLLDIVGGAVVVVIGVTIGRLVGRRSARVQSTPKAALLVAAPTA